MPLVLLSALAIAAAAPPPKPASPRPASAEQEIVVTGVSLESSERALRECLARKCPPKEDIAASLADAENLFVGGKYDDAFRVTRESIDRNRRYRKTYPIDVSDLYRAHARIAAHLGDRDAYEMSAGDMHQILADAFPKTDPRVIGADLEWADVYASLNQFNEADGILRDAEKRAEAAGRADFVGIARVKRAWLNVQKGQAWVARQQLNELAADHSPAAASQRIFALARLAELDRLEGKTGNLEVFMAEMRSHHFKQPVLLFAPSLNVIPRLGEGDTANGQPMSTGSLESSDICEECWIDVGFWVTPEGKVRDAQILRNQGPTAWSKPLLRSIAGRIYSPVEDPSGVYRVERYTYTSRWINTTESRIHQRSPNGRIEYLDLTRDSSAEAR